MPPGYAAFFLWVAAAVLWWSGWREETAEGIPDRAVAVFLAGWPCTAWKNTSLWEAPSIQLNGAFMWTTLAMAALALRVEPAARWTAFSAGILCGSFAVLLTFSPVFYLSAPEWAASRGIALMVGLMTAVLCKGASGQFVCVSMALCLYEGLSAAWLKDSQQVLIGQGRWMESWWVAVLAARLTSVVAATAAARIGRDGWRREGEGT